MKFNVGKIHRVSWFFFTGSLLILLGTLVLATIGTDWLDQQRLNPVSLRTLPQFLQINNFWKGALPPVVLSGLLVASTAWLPRRPWSLALLGSLLMVVALRYFVWRAMSINTAHPLSLICSSLQFLVELLYLLSTSLELRPSLRFDPSFRSRQADELETWVNREKPKVDIWIPTYNEPSEMVARAIMSCQNLNYANRKITVLDDGHRPAIARLALKLGVQYLSREGNAHRKAGNLNHALAKTKAEFIAVFDCDFVPFPQFLNRTLGFFRNPRVALVQTPQHYFQAEFHNRNLGLDSVMPSDLDLFFRYQQVIRDRSNAVVCCGTSYVVRRRALEEIGGYVTSCLIEDHQTSTKLLTHGWVVHYLNEVLSMGEVPRSFPDFLDQRLRWMQGNIQIYFRHKELPIWKKLNNEQRSFYLTLAVSSLSPIWRLCYLILPLTSLILGFTLIAAPPIEYLAYGIPFVLLLHALPSWLCDYHQFQFWNEVYETLFCIPGTRRLTQILRQPFQIFGGTVTKKEAAHEHFTFNLSVNWPLLTLLAVFGLSLLARYVLPFLAPRTFGSHEGFDGESLMLAWNLYNGIMISLALLACMDMPNRRSTDRFPIQRVGYIETGKRKYWGKTVDISEQGACFSPQGCHNELTSGTTVSLEIIEPSPSLPSLTIQARIVRTEKGNIAMRFQHVEAPANNELLRFLYSEDHEFHAPKRLGRTEALLLWIQALWRPFPILRTSK